MTISDDDIELLERAKRWADVVRVLIERGDDESVEPTSRCDALVRAMRIFVEKFANQHEAIAVAERALLLDPGQADAIDFLRAAYAARRQFDKLAALESRVLRK